MRACKLTLQPTFSNHAALRTISASKHFCHCRYYRIEVRSIKSLSRESSCFSNASLREHDFMFATCDISTISFNSAPARRPLYQSHVIIVTAAKDFHFLLECLSIFEHSSTIILCSVFNNLFFFLIYNCGILFVGSDESSLNIFGPR